ncbi:hypothetical protein F3Y22_tig00111655pilonHSYRG00015 [Hibiscus syriacus]|uniref:Uncharacterized protein n=1 Tax=Hibiscus syriacus TaxID=106335 RepID=A0A6A2XYT2_HIBSY|nr:hypothetical protein F3Y22_tig00111655pilonHSYRG00015 [Hibiscus syriacus]
MLHSVISRTGVGPTCLRKANNKQPLVWSRNRPPAEPCTVTRERAPSLFKHVHHHHQEETIGDEHGQGQQNFLFE